MASPTVAVNVIADTRKFTSSMTDTNSVLKGFGVAAGVAFAAAGAAALAFAGQSVKSASDLQQSIGGVESVFKEYASTVEESSKKASQALGLSRNSYNQVATIIGTQLKASGTTLDALAGKTDALVTVAADLAATFGGPVTDATTAVTSALRGEFEPLRRYGISLSVAAIEAEALSMTQKELASDLTAAEKSAAAQALIFRGATDATGAFTREADTLAGQQERLKANFENIKATLGEQLLPVITSATTGFNDLLTSLVEDPEFQAFITDLTLSLESLIPQIVETATQLLYTAVDVLPALNLILPIASDLLSILSMSLDDVDVSGEGVFKTLSDIQFIVQEVTRAIEKMDTWLGDMSDGFLTIKPIIDSVYNALFPLADLLSKIVAGIQFAQNSKSITNKYTGLKDSQGRNIIPFAEGGIVMPRPGGTLAQIGEAGQAEAVIPLDRLERMIGGGSGVTVNVQGNVGWSPNQLADLVYRKQRQAYALQGLNGIIGVR